MSRKQPYIYQFTLLSLAGILGFYSATASYLSKSSRANREFLAFAALLLGIAVCLVLVRLRTRGHKKLYYFLFGIECPVFLFVTIDRQLPLRAEAGLMLSLVMSGFFVAEAAMIYRLWRETRNEPSH